MQEEMKTTDRFPKDMPTPKKSVRLRLVALALIVILFVGGGAIAFYLYKTKPTATRKKPPRMQTLVTTMIATPETSKVAIMAQGTIVPAKEITLQSRVSGEITYLHPGLTPGGIVKKNEVLIRIDDADYRLALQRKENALALARADLRIEEGNQQIAMQEWAIVKEQFTDMDTSSKDLVLRKPQLEKARANITAATTDVEGAMLNLSRTEIKAPFNGIVRTKNVDLGSQASPQSALAVLSGTDTFWAEVSLPLDKLAWINLPKGTTPGSTVMIMAGGGTAYKGTIVKLLADIDPDGLMARLRIAVQDPMGLAITKQPLLLGSVVRVEITGKTLTNVFRVPRSAMVNGNRVLIATPESTLHIKSITVAWKDEKHIFIKNGIKAGDRIITSTVPAPIEGMPLDLGDKNAGDMKKKGMQEKMKDGN